MKPSLKSLDYSHLRYTALNHQNETMGHYQSSISFVPSVMYPVETPSGGGCERWLFRTLWLPSSKYFPLDETVATPQSPWRQWKHMAWCFWWDWGAERERRTGSVLCVIQRLGMQLETRHSLTGMIQRAPPLWIPGRSIWERNAYRTVIEFFMSWCWRLLLTF